ncbi:hypothetical protein V5O48_015274 [Marasmius crinis-equi]|uniref:F-box domain-containing protein n=1 Tax=Marasmius crinis-equi TaxID=585013 RepID=A0ABR3EV04_9AGAR
MEPSLPTRPVLCPQCNLTFLSHVAHPPLTKAQIRSQHFLLPDQIGRLKTQIKDEQLELERWDEELSRLRGVLEDMQSHRDALSQQLSERRSLLSASRRLPDELWLEIFSLCVPGSRLGVSEDQWNQVSAEPLWLSHVCTRWRDIITSSRSMWSSVYVNLYALERDVVSVLKWYLELGCDGGSVGGGGGKGIDLVIRYDKDTLNWKYGTTPLRIRNMRSPTSWTEHSQNALSFLLRTENMRRLRKLSISGIDSQLSTGETEMDLPLLESVFLDAEIPRDASPGPMWLWKSIQQASRLRDVVLGCDLPLSTSSLTTILSHSQIRSLKVLDVGQLEGGISDVVQLLTTIPNLETLRVDGIRGSDSLDLPGVPTSVECPNLRRLTTHFGDGQAQDAFLRSLHLPQLEFLSISGAKCTLDLEASESLVSTLRNHAARSTLRELVFDYEIEPEVQVLPEILRALPNLEAFSAKVKGGGRERIPNLLGELAKDSSLVSKLQSITLEECDSYLDFDMAERIVPLLEHLPPTLNEVALVFGFAWTFEEAEKPGNSERIEKVARRLRALDERGMRCGFFYASWGTTTFVVGSRELNGDSL